jgi:acetyltransferase
MSSVKTYARWTQTEKLIGYCRSRGTKELVGEALADNKRLRGLVQRFGFAVTASPATHTVNLKLELAASGPQI